MAGNYFEWEECSMGPIPYETEWPLDVPKDDNDLYAKYGAFVAAKVRRHNRVEGNFDDLLQEIWSKLIAAKLLEKFKLSGASRLPLVMTGDEAQRFLGISNGVWKGFLYRFETDPIAGKRFSRHAIFWTADIVDMDGMLCDRPRHNRVRPRLTARGFKAYLEQAVHNSFANYCRTKDRRHKDHPISGTANLVPTSSGEYRRSVDLENQSCWEDGIAAAMTIEREDVIDLSRQIRKANIDMDSPEGAELLDFLVKQGKSCDDGPQRNLDTLSLLGQGYTLTEAIKKAKARSRKRQQQAMLG